MKPLRKSSKLIRIFQRAADGGNAVWKDLLNGLLRVIRSESRRHREPYPLSIRHVWMYMREWTLVNLSGTAIIVVYGKPSGFV